MLSDKSTALKCSTFLQCYCNRVCSNFQVFLVQIFKIFKYLHSFKNLILSNDSSKQFIYLGCIACLKHQ